MKIIKTVKKWIQYKKADRQAKKFLAEYWKIKEQGKTTSQEDDVASEIMQQRIQLFFLETKVRNLRKQTRINRRKIFCVDYVMGFVISDKGKIFFRGSVISAVVIFLRLSFSIFWGILTNQFNENNEYIKKRFYLFFGVKRTAKKTGFSEDFLIAKDTDVLLENL